MVGRVVVRSPAREILSHRKLEISWMGNDREILLLPRNARPVTVLGQVKFVIELGSVQGPLRIACPRGSSRELTSVGDSVSGD